MRYIYKNKKPQSVSVSLVSENGSSVNYITISADSVVELNYPGLDFFVPHLLSRIDENGYDISHLVLAAAEKKAEEKPAPVVKEAPAPVVEEVVEPVAEPVVSEEAPAPVVEEVVEPVAEPVLEKPKKKK